MKGVVVKADLLKNCAMNDEGMSPVDGIDDVEADNIFDVMKLPTYTTVVSYVTPAPVTIHGKGIRPPSIYLQSHN